MGWYGGRISTFRCKWEARAACRPGRHDPVCTWMDRILLNLGRSSQSDNRGSANQALRLDKVQKRIDGASEVTLVRASLKGAKGEERPIWRSSSLALTHG